MNLASLKTKHFQLLERKENKFGMIFSFSLLLLSSYRILFKVYGKDLGNKALPTSFLGYLPKEFYQTETLLISFQLIFLLSTTLWFSRKFLLITPFLTATSYAFINSYYTENLFFGASHASQLVGGCLFIYAAWFTSEKDYFENVSSIFEAFKGKRFPHWVFSLTLFYIAATYSLSGLYKLRISGFEWANGLSLQSWIHFLGKENSFSLFLLNNKTYARSIQFFVLALETLSITAIFHTFFKLGIGLFLLIFHLAVAILFDWFFIENVVLIILTFFPFYKMVNQYDF